MQQTININLQSILDLSTQLNETKDIKTILNLCVLSIIGKLGISKSIVYLYDKNQYIFQLSKGTNLISENFEYFNVLLEKIPKRDNEGQFKLNNNEFFESLSKNESYFDLNNNQNNLVNEFKDRLFVTNNKVLDTFGYKFILPIYYSESLIAVIFIGDKILKKYLTEDEIFYIQLVLNITSSALENAKNYTSLLSQKNKSEKRNQLLQTLFEISKDFGFFTTQENILKNFSLSLMGQLQLTRYMLVCFDIKSNQITSKIKQNRLVNAIEENELIPIWQFEKTTDLRFLYQIDNRTSNNINRIESTKINSEINDLDYNNLNTKNKAICNILETNPIFKQFILQNEITFIIPVFVQGQKKGVVLLGKKLTTKYSIDEIKFVESLSNTAIASIENLRLFQEEIEKKKIDNEIKIALEIQKNLLPKSDPVVDGIDIAGITLASRYVGGDYYDYIKINEDIYFIIIADVTGKGIPASILMANIQAAVKLLCFTDENPAIIAEKLNKLICSNTTIDKFASVFMGFLNIKEKSLQYVNAGHNHPFIYNKYSENLQFLSTDNMLIGVLDFNKYNSKKVNFIDGDIFVMFTDGVVEAQYNNQEFSEEKLINLVKKNKDSTSLEIIQSFLTEIDYRHDAVNLYDDITKIVMKF